MRYSFIPLIAACALASNLALADSTITFEGEISDQTCEVKVNGVNVATVTLPTISAKRLNDDDTAGQQSFQINVSGCNKDKENKFSVRFRTDSSADITEGGNLKNIAQTTPAKDVAVQLFTEWDGKKEIKFDKGQGFGVSPVIILPAGETDGTYAFYARYISENKKAESGHVTAKVTYLLEYQ